MLSKRTLMEPPCLSAKPSTSDIIDTGFLALSRASLFRCWKVVRLMKVSTEVPEENLAAPPVGRM